MYVFLFISEISLLIDLPFPPLFLLLDGCRLQEDVEKC